MNLASAVFFFVYPQPPEPSMLHVIDGTWVPNDHVKRMAWLKALGSPFKLSTAASRCGGAEENAQSLNRIAYYSSPNYKCRLLMMAKFSAVRI